MTLAGRNGISASCCEDLVQFRIVSMSYSFTEKSSQLRTALSRRMRIEYGRDSEAKNEHVNRSVSNVENS